MQLPPNLRCHKHGEPLVPKHVSQDGISNSLVCPSNCHAPIVRNIPRFVDSTNYAAAFGLQWNAFRTTQLDSFTGTTITRDRLARCLGGSLDILRGKTVLEVGCGAGRFTELMLGAGAHVVACDLSSAVEANYANCHSLGGPNYFVCQADLRSLPFVPASFDFVVVLGVIQHTPDPEETIETIARFVRPGGTLVIDHYSHGYPQNFLRIRLRQLFIHLPPGLATQLARGLAVLLLPLHRVTWKNPGGLSRLRASLMRHSPLMDYFDAYPQLGERLLSEWAVLDTHDSLTDYYKHFRTNEQIEASLQACGLVDVEVASGGNGVEARARVPLF